MEEKLQTILKEYIKEVESACNNLLRGINCSENLNLKTKYVFFEYRASNKRMEFEVGGIRYKLHGKGCMAFNEEMFIDWDFGYRSRWCGIDPWKVSMTLEKNRSNSKEYFNGNVIKTSCDLLVERGIMFKKFDQYYFRISENETFKPEFPSEYDTLIVEHSNLRWMIPRNKAIDRFIKKSRRVSNQIDKSEDKYMLRFLQKEKEIYSIPYDDIGYPESAVKIMSDEILQNLLKKS